MKRKFISSHYAFTIGIFTTFLMSGILNAQTILYQENFGIPNSNTLVQNYTGWQDTSVLYISNGTCDVRKTNASVGYSSASGGGNVMINDTVKWFQVSGIVVPNETNAMNLYVGLRKTASENGSNFRVQYSGDSIIWNTLLMQDTLPTGTGTSGWYRVKYQNVPYSPKLHVRFCSMANVEYRLDDICLTDGDEVVMEAVSNPSFSIQSGTYYEPQVVSLETATEGAAIWYTIDGTLPSENTNLYVSPLEIISSCYIKAIAVKDGMMSSDVVSLNLTIVDTNALVELPFDISDNSYTDKCEIKVMNGFKSKKLGSSYSDGGAKFEAKSAGEAFLLARLDAMPDSLFFDVQGNKSGNPSLYSGISFIVSESEDGETWNDIVTINESMISTNRYSHFGGYGLNYKTRYIRWKLLSAEVGNTQLNNIRITKRHSEPSDEVGITSFSNLSELNIIPNPVSSIFCIRTEENIEYAKLYDMKGMLLKSWSTESCNGSLDISDLPDGSYVLLIGKQSGMVEKKIVLKI